MQGDKEARAKDILKEFDNLVMEMVSKGLPEVSAREKALEYQKEKYKSNSFSDKIEKIS